MDFIQRARRELELNDSVCTYVLTYFPRKEDGLGTYLSCDDPEHDKAIPVPGSEDPFYKREVPGLALGDFGDARYGEDSFVV